MVTACSPDDLTTTSADVWSPPIIKMMSSKLRVTWSSITFMATMKVSESEDLEKANTSFVENRLEEVNLFEALMWETAL